MLYEECDGDRVYRNMLVWLQLPVGAYEYVCIHVYVCICIERERDMNIYIYI